MMYHENARKLNTCGHFIVAGHYIVKKGTTEAVPFL